MPARWLEKINKAVYYSYADSDDYFGDKTESGWGIFLQGVPHSIFPTVLMLVPQARGKAWWYLGNGQVSISCLAPTGYRTADGFDLSIRKDVSPEAEKHLKQIVPAAQIVWEIYLEFLEIEEAIDDIEWSLGEKKRIKETRKIVTSDNNSWIEEEEGKLQEKLNNLNCRLNQLKQVLYEWELVMERYGAMLDLIDDSKDGVNYLPKNVHINVDHLMKLIEDAQREN